jgi:hypothetical protein
LATVPVMTSTRSAGGTALAVLAFSLVAGAGAGLAIGAVLYNDGGSFYGPEWALMVQQPLDGADKAFNWLVFCLFASAGIVASAAAWAAVTVSNSIADAHAQQMKALAALKPPAVLLPPPPDTLRTSGASLGL